MIRSCFLQSVLCTRQFKSVHNVMYTYYAQLTPLRKPIIYSYIVLIGLTIKKIKNQIKKIHIIILWPLVRMTNLIRLTAGNYDFPRAILFSYTFTVADYELYNTV